MKYLTIVQDVGYGTPFERRKQYEQKRVEKAAEAVRDYNVQKHASSNTLSEEAALIVKDKKKAKDIKTRCVT